MPTVNSVSDEELPLTWIKADFHLHTAEDPYDEVDITAREVVELAQARGFDALAVTLHRHVFNDDSVFDYAREKGILLIPGAELRVEGADVVVLNITPAEAAAIHSFDDLRELRATRGTAVFMFAPHPFYILGGSIGKRAEEHIDCFDAIEFCHFHVPLLNPNRKATRLAAAHGKPLLATSDSHQRRSFGRNYSMIGIDGLAGGAMPSVEQVFAGMRAHRIRRLSPTGGLLRFLNMLLFVFVITPFLRRLPTSKRSLARRREAGRRAARQGRSLGARAPADPAAHL